MLPPSPRQTRLLNTNDTLMAVVSLEQTLQRQACEVGFRTAVSAFDALRFLTDHLKRMPLSAQVRCSFFSVGRVYNLCL